jgi:hypothetical protein
MQHAIARHPSKSILAPPAQDFREASFILQKGNSGRNWFETHGAFNGGRFLYEYMASFLSKVN